MKSITTTLLALTAFGLGCSSSASGDKAEIKALRAKLVDAREMISRNLAQEVSSGQATNDFLSTMGPVLDESERSFAARRNKGGLEQVVLIREHIVKSKEHHARKAKMAAELIVKLQELNSFEK